MNFCRILYYNKTNLWKNVHGSYSSDLFFIVWRTFFWSNRFSSVNSITTIKNQYSGNVNGKLEKALLLLNTDIKNRNRVRKSDVQRALDVLSCGDFVSVENGVLLLKCCGNLLPDEIPEARVQLAHTMWSTLKENGTVFTVDHYKALLSCYLDNGYSVSPEDFLSRMKNLKPDEATLNLLLQCVCKNGDIELAVYVVERMKVLGYPVTEVVFNALILANGKAGDAESSFKVLEMMSLLGLSPSGETYSALLQVCARCNDDKNLESTYETAKIEGITFTVEQLLDTAECCLLSGNTPLFHTVLQWFPNVDAASAKPIINRIIHWVHLNHEDAAFQMLKILPPSVMNSFTDSSGFGTFFIKEMVYCDRPVSAIVKICQELSSEGYNAQSLLKATEISLQLGKVDTALELFIALKKFGHPLRPHYFWPLFMVSGKMYGEKGVLFILDHMKSLGVVPDFETLSYYILPHMTMVDPAMVVRKLQDHQLELNLVFTPILAVLIRSGHVKPAEKLCKTYKAHIKYEELVKPLCLTYRPTNLPSVINILKLMHRETTNVDWTGQFLLELIAKKKEKIQMSEVWSIIKKLNESSMKISSFASDVLFYNLKDASVDDEKRLKEVLNSLVDMNLHIHQSETPRISHPKDMSLEELECHLVELKSKDLNTRGVLRRLMQLYCQNSNLEKALAIKREFEACGFEYSAGMTSSLLDLYIKLSMLEEAESCLQELNELSSKFTVDEYKILDFAKLLVKNNRLKCAKLALKERAYRGRVRSGSPTLHNCRELLEIVSEKYGPKETREMFDLLIKLGYCDVSNIVLGPLIRANIKSGNLQDAVTDFVNCTVKHKVTPLLHELMCVLVEEADKSELHQTLLQQVLDAAKMIHGTPNTHVSLVIALAEKNKTAQLNRLLADPTLKLNIAHLMKNCERLMNENKLNVMRTLLVSFKNVPGFPVSSLCTLMMRVHCRMGDCDGALALWLSLQDMNIIPSFTFLEIFRNLLLSYKREVPFQISENCTEQKNQQ